MKIITFLQYKLSITERRDNIISEIEKLDINDKRLNREIVNAFINYLKVYIDYLLYNTGLIDSKIAKIIFDDIEKYN